MIDLSTLRSWLASPAARDVEQALRRASIPTDEAMRSLDRVTHDPASTAGVRAIRDRADVGPRPLERWLLVRRGIDALAALERAALPDSCRMLTATDIAALGGAEVDDAALHESRPRFREFAKIVTGRRFSAGLFHFEIDGIPREWLLKVRRSDLLRVWTFVALRMRGRRPVIVPHITWRRPVPPITREAVEQSYAVMADVLQCQRSIKGLAGSSWLRSPDTQRVSPRLRCVNAPIVEHDGLETTMGPAPPDCGVLSRSNTRKALYEQGLFTPTIGLTLWPREAMLAWRRDYGRTNDTSTGWWSDAATPMSADVSTISTHSSRTPASGVKNR